MAERVAPLGPLRLGASRLDREDKHELLNIFSIISANADLVREDPEAAASRQRRLERIVSACRRGETLVRRLGHPDSPPESRKEASVREATGGGEPSGRVLVVDDEADIVEIIGRYLMKAGYSVQGVTDSEEALAMMQANPFCCDLLITDLDMPGMSGGALCSQLEAIRPALPVLLITGYDREFADEQNPARKGKDLLLKPLDRGLLLDAVRRLLTA